MFDPRRIVFAVLMAAVVGGLVSPLFAREEIVPQANAPAWPPEPIVLNGTTAVGVSDDQQTVVIAVDQLGDGRAQTTFSLGLAPGSRAPEAGVGNARVIATPSRVTLQRESSIHIFSVVGKDTGPAPTQPVIQLLALIKGGVKDMTLEQAITHYLKTENRPVKRAGEPDFFASCASRSRQVQLLGLVAAAMNPFAFAKVGTLDPCTAGGPGSGNCSIGGCSPPEGGPESCSVGTCEKGYYPCCWCAPEARCHCVQDTP